MSNNENENASDVADGVSSRIKQLKINRGQVKSSLTRFATFLDKFTDDKIVNLEVRLKNIETSLLTEFSTVQGELEFLDGSGHDDQEREGFEDKYYETTGRAINIIRNFYSKSKTNTNLMQAQTSSLSTASSLQQNAASFSKSFPAIELMKFYGDYDKWDQFHDLYVTLVHNDGSIDKIRKFYYLLGSLKGNAAKVLESIKVTADNYDLAWTLLKERFENKALTIKNNVKALFNIPTVSREYSLRNLLDDFQKRYRALKILGEPVEKWSTLLIYLITSKLDSRTLNQWEESVITKNLSTAEITDLEKFLSDRCKLLETSDIQSKSAEFKAQKHSGHKQIQNHEKHKEKYQSYHSYSAQEGSGFECPSCKEKHNIYNCKKLLNMTVASRAREIEKLKLCLNCLRQNHVTEDCFARGCKVCSKKHNTLLHTDSIENKHSAEQNNQSNVNVNQNKNRELTATGSIPNVKQTSGISVNYSQEGDPEVLLSTAIVLVQASNGIWHQCRALLDCGSQANFLTNNLVEKLKLSTSDIDFPIVGIGNSESKISCRVSTQIKSTDNKYRCELNFLILDAITEKLPNVHFKKSLIKIPENIFLADRDFNVPAPIDMLIGASVFYDILKPEQKRLGDISPMLQNTVFGWIISGPLPIKQNGNRIKCNFSLNQPNLEKQLENFWHIEEYPPKKFYTPEETECERIFSETINRDTDGRFITMLPIKENAEPIGESLNNAIIRLKSMERKFIKQPEFKKQYVEFMNEYESLGHMQKIDPENIKVENNGKNVFYLPHHGVRNENSSTTSLRVVFDASCSSSSGTSLNDILMIGPSIQDELFPILIRFRQHNVVLTADVAKMYRQVKISKNQQDLQRIVWRANPNDEISHYQLLTVTYGTGSASFLATPALQQAAIENRKNFPTASNVILKDFYVDDLITGVDTAEDAKKLKFEINNILAEYGFILRKWSSNKMDILESEISADQYYVNDGDIKRALGIVWHAKEDFLTYSVKEINTSNISNTKRGILSKISTIFDPLGLIAPLIVRAKILIQKLWQCKQGWDETVPPDIACEWNKLLNELPLLNNIKIKRQTIISNAKRLELHIFCDASQVAYGSCAYLRSISQNDTVQTCLLCAKSKVAPLKILTIPRLELCSAVLAVKLFEKIQESINITLDEVYFWSDSTIVLSWLQIDPSKLKIFVANRIAEIQVKTAVNQWRHVPTTSNPADLVSRGVNVNDLKSSQLWWAGPKWLENLNCNTWPTLTLTNADLPELKNKIALSVTVKNDFNIFERFSTWFRLSRIIALCFRFYFNCKNKEKRRSGNLSVEELNNARLILLKIAQGEMYPTETHCVELSKNLSKKSNLLSLNPILGPNGLLRVGGRLSKSNLSYDSKHQIILAPKHPLTKLIILDEHHKRLHSGTLSILSALREQYWVVHGRREVRNVLNHCVTCFRHKPKPIIRQMGNLPLDRVTQNRPFYITGVDFAGPFLIKDGKLKNRAVVKAYLCLFICFATKAVHLEAVVDLSTDAFLNALKRFVSRRGLCKTIYSDNGTNFTGASNDLKRFYNDIPNFVKNEEISNFLLKNCISWSFIPPRAPHHGGLWEASVKRAKFHIARVIGKNQLTFEQMSTLCAQVEAAINSSPITPLSEDPFDFTCLTPGHFLIGQPLLSLPQTDLTTLPSNRLNHYEELQQMFQSFWKRWSKDYLLGLQQRSKWKEATNDTLRIGALVLLIDDNLPPLYWKMARVLKLHPGNDGVSRVATVKAINGITKRAVQKLCPLPIDS